MQANRANPAAKRSSQRIGHRVDSLTRGVKATAPGGNEVAPAARDDEDTRRALFASEIYAGRIIASLYEVVSLVRGQQRTAARELLGDAVSGIHCLVDLLGAVSEVPGVKTPAATDQQMGEVALGLHSLDVARARGDYHGVATAIEMELVPALTRLVPSFHHIEGCLGSLADKQLVAV